MDVRIQRSPKMKKFAFCLVFLIPICFSLHAFDDSVIGSWGLIMFGDKEEVIRFGTNEVLMGDMLFSSEEFEAWDDTLIIYDNYGQSIVKQYYLLSPNKLLFISWNSVNIEEQITLILTRF